MTDAILKLDNISLAFGELQVLDGLSLDLREGEFVSILGPSGCGKSTILKILTGAVRASRGVVDFRGDALESENRPFAFMPQRDALMPWRRIIDNTTIGLEIQGMARRDARSRVAPLFAEFGLAGFENHYPAALSGGMRQRAALLRTVVQDRPILLLDEPFGALDALTRNQMQIWLETVWARHRWTAMLVTHDIHEAVLLSDRIYVLSPRPARTAQVIKVTLPRPRFSDASIRARATAIENSILDLLFSPQNGDTP